MERQRKTKKTTKINAIYIGLELPNHSVQVSFFVSLLCFKLRQRPTAVSTCSKSTTLLILKNLLARCTRSQQNICCEKMIWKHLIVMAFSMSQKAMTVFIANGRLFVKLHPIHSLAQCLNLIAQDAVVLVRDAAVHQDKINLWQNCLDIFCGDP